MSLCDVRLPVTLGYLSYMYLPIIEISWRKTTSASLKVEGSFPHPMNTYVSIFYYHQCEELDSFIAITPDYS